MKNSVAPADIANCTEVGAYIEAMRKMMKTIKTTNRKPYTNTPAGRACMCACMPACLPCCFWSMCIRLLCCPVQCCSNNACTEMSDACLGVCITGACGVEKLEQPYAPYMQYTSADFDAMSRLVADLQTEFSGVGQGRSATKVHYLLVEHVVTQLIAELNPGLCRPPQGLTPANAVASLQTATGWLQAGKAEAQAYTATVQAAKTKTKAKVQAKVQAKTGL